MLFAYAEGLAEADIDFFLKNPSIRNYLLHQMEDNPFSSNLTSHPLMFVTMTKVMTATLIAHTQKVKTSDAHLNLSHGYFHAALAGIHAPILEASVDPQANFDTFFVALEEGLRPLVGKPLVGAGTLGALQAEAMPPHLRLLETVKLVTSLKGGDRTLFVDRYFDMLSYNVFLGRLSAESSSFTQEEQKTQIRSELHATFLAHLVEQWGEGSLPESFKKGLANLRNYDDQEHYQNWIAFWQMVERRTYRVGLFEEVSEFILKPQDREKGAHTPQWLKKQEQGLAWWLAELDQAETGDSRPSFLRTTVSDMLSQVQAKKRAWEKPSYQLPPISSVDISL